MGRKFVLRTDHASLVWLMRFKNLTGILARWIKELACFNLDIVHRAGKKHINADALTRTGGDDLNCDNFAENISLKDLPCYDAINHKVCPSCSKIEQQWSKFFEDVDYVVPLTSTNVRNVSVVTPTRDDLDGWLPDYGSVNWNIQAIHASQEIEPDDFGNWVPRYSCKELAKKQKADPDIRRIIKFLVKGREPSEGDRAIASPAFKHYWLMRWHTKVI